MNSALGKLKGYGDIDGKSSRFISQRTQKMGCHRRSVRFHALAAVAVPWYGWRHGFDGGTWAMFAFFVSFNNLSITTGYHRLWAHKTYKANALICLLLALGGAFAL